MYKKRPAPQPAESHVVEKSPIPIICSTEKPSFVPQRDKMNPVKELENLARAKNNAEVFIKLILLKL